MTIASALQFSQACLNQTSDAAHLDAERLLLQVLGRGESAWLYARYDQQLPVEAEQRFRELTLERATGKPLAYILGEWEFWGRPFFVTPDVLVPRPETEGLVEAALAYVASQLSVVSGPLVIADIGTGSGCIAVTLACELANFQFIATDISPAALAVARTNAKRHGVADQIEFLEGDMLSPVSDRKIDLIVSNPPYIPSNELSSPKLGEGRGVRYKETVGLTFEPRVALDGGQDGQYFINQLKNAGVPALVEGTNGEIITWQAHRARQK